MENNEQYFGAEARKKLLDGMRRVFRSASPTYGANGRNAVYNKWSGQPVASNDGKNVAHEIRPADPGEKQGVALINQVAEATNAELEDGSTATIINTFTLCETGSQLVDSDAKISPMKLRREMKEATNRVIEELKNSAVVINGVDDLKNLAITSVESEEIGTLIAETIYNAGDNGIIYINESDKVGVSVEKIEGYQFHQGMITPYLFTNVDKLETVLENPAILVTEIPLHLTNEFMGLVSELVGSGRKNILVICDEIHPDVLKFAVMNTLKHKFTLSIVKKPMQKEYLEDIAAIVGANAMTVTKGMQVPKLEYVGTCSKVVIGEKITTIFTDNTELVTSYVTTLKSQLDAVKDDEIATDKLQERIARLTGGVFLLNVGEKTPAQLKYLRDKVDDAVNSLRKIFREKQTGGVPGGGSALYHIGKKLLAQDSPLTNGEKIVYNACLAPLKQLLKNGGEDIEEFCSKLDLKPGSGYNAKTMQYEDDMIKVGIVDATKVIATSFLNSSNFASDFVTYEVLISPVELPKEVGLMKQ